MKYKPRGYWTKEVCAKTALNFKTRKEFQLKGNLAYQYALKNKWLDDICTHMVYVIKPKGYWTKELCQVEALKFNTRTNFEKGNGSAYAAASKNGWLNEICLHMVTPLSCKPRGYWTKERCYEVALTCQTKLEFSTKYSRAYRNSRINGWLDEVCSHMTQFRKPNGYWTKERCQIEALKYKSRKEFNDNNRGCYQYASGKGWSNEICSHMITTTKPMGYWNNYEHCEEAAKHCKNIGDFCVKSRGYKVAYKNNWLHKLFPNSPYKKKKVKNNFVITN